MTHVLGLKRTPEPAIVAAFKEHDVATVYEASGRKGYVDRAIVRAAPGDRICGPAYTVQCAPGDNLMLHKALERAPSGAVIVASVGGAYDYGYWGGLMATAAKARGLAGLAIDGCIRDSAEIASMGFPVFCRGFSVRGTAKGVLGLVNYPINFGGMTVFPGDLVIGDADGMVVVRFEDCDAVLAKTRERVEFEENKAAQLKAGMTSVELNKLGPVFESLGLVEE